MRRWNGTCIGVLPSMKALNLRSFGICYILNPSQRYNSGYDYPNESEAVLTSRLMGFASLLRLDEWRLSMRFDRRAMSRLDM